MPAGVIPPSILDLVALINELKADLAALRNDFRGHDHGATYVAASWRIHNAAGVAASSGTETNSATAAADLPVPSAH